MILMDVMLDHTLLSTLEIGNRAWQLPAGVLLAVAVGCAVVAYVLTPLRGGERWVALALKVVGLALLAACLIEPLWTGTRAKPGENIIAVVLDRSASLTVQPGSRSLKRSETFAELLSDDEAAWQTRLGQDFSVRKYALGERLASVDGFEEVVFDAAGSSLQTGLLTLAERFEGRPLVGVLLFTDGNATDLAAASMSLEGLPPIYPVLPDDEEIPQDLSISNISVTQAAFEDAPVSLQVDVTGEMAEGTPLRVAVVDADGKLIKSETGQWTVGNDVLPFRFQLRPTGAGVSDYSVMLWSGDASAGDATSLPERLEDEATIANNARLVSVDREQGPYRVLYVSGRPNWEFKFLRRAVEDDDEVRLVGLIRIARKEAKFDFRGRDGESSNSLFRGFKGEGDEETESYDQPVLLRVGTEDEHELAGGFPKEQSVLYEYDAIIIDDVEAEFFTPDQLALIERFVAERGGGLLMLGGQDSFRRGGYNRTPVGNVLPVYLDRAAGTRTRGPYRLDLTRDGWLQPWVRLRTAEEAEKLRLKEMPSFTVLNTGDSIKPAARVLAEVSSSDGTKYPALVAQQFGKGRTGAVMIGDLWKWSLRRADLEEDDLAKAWRQTVRWLVADIPRRVHLAVEEETTTAGQHKRLLVEARDAEYAPLDDATAQVTITLPDKQTITIDADPSTEAAGQFVATFTSKRPGAYRAQVTVTDKDGEVVGTDETGWTHDPLAKEFASVSVNRPLMEQWADATGGEVVTADRLAALVRDLPNRQVEVTETWTRPLWHEPWMLILAILCLAGEWALRRWRGLA